MAKPYPMEMRVRAMARLDAGESIRTIGEALSVVPSTVSKWDKLRRESGSLAPRKTGGHVPRKIRDENAAWLLERIRSAPFTLRGLVVELAARGLEVDYRTVWNFVHAARLSYKKKPGGERTRPA